MPYTVDEALLESINKIDADVLRTANQTNTNVASGFSHTSRQIADGDCETQRDILESSQRAIDTINSSMERKAIANDLNGFNNTHAVLGAINQNSQRIVDIADRNSTANLLATSSSSAQNLAATNANAAEIMHSSERLMVDNHRLGRDMTNQHNYHNIETLKGVCDIKSEIANRYSKNEERHNDRHQRLELELARHNAASQLQGSENYARLQLELCKLDNNLGKDILKTSADAKFQSADNLRQTQLDSAKFEGTVARQHEQVLNNLCRMESKLELQAEKNTASIQLEALRNRSDILCKVEQCCCELKSEIKSADNERLRDRNLLLEFENSRQRTSNH
jgi:hypothetical protein